MVEAGHTPSPSPTKPCPWRSGHRFDSFLEEGRVRHEFTMRVEDGRVPQDGQLLIADTQPVLNGAISVTAAGAPRLAVPVPAE